MELRMTPEPASPQKSPLKNPYFYTAVVMVFVLGYVAFVLISRYDSNRDIDRRNAERAAEQRRADDRAAVEQFGGSELAIRALYLRPATIRRGQSSQLCYDVANAKTVTLDPPAGAVWPSHTRCLDVSPAKTTTYTLTIADASGKTASQSVELLVH
jgi:hypothetical protein